MKRNYQIEMEEEIERLAGRRPTLLLHSCCGPCSSAVLERLTEHFRVTLLYYNPNIEPEEEYRLRLSEQERLLRLLPGGVDGFLRAYAEEYAFRFAERKDFEECLFRYAGMDLKPLLLDYLDTAMD